MRLMVLGGGSCQLNLMKRAKSRGHYVILIDYLEQPIGKENADVHLRISTFDKENVYQAALQYQIEGIVTLGTDQPVYTCAYVAKKMKLFFYIDDQVALWVTNKSYMKRIFKENKIPTVNYVMIKREFKEEELKGISFPVIMKPVDSQGQKGIYKLNSVEEIRNKIEETLSFSREKEVLIEEFYKNDEITVNGWIQNAELTLLSVVDRVTIKDINSVGVCLCHHFKSVYLDRYYYEIEALTKKIISSFQLSNGPIYFQYLIGSEGIKVNEIAMRIGGAYEDITIPLITGTDILSMLLDYIETGKTEDESYKKYQLMNNRKYLSTQMFFLRPGKIASMTKKKEVLQCKGVLGFHYHVAVGDISGTIYNARARAGYFLVEGNTFSDMIENVNGVFNQMEVLDENGHNLLIKYSEYQEKYIYHREGRGAD